MPVYVVWESRFASADAEAGLEVTEAIWRDMRTFAGYLGHELIRAVDNGGLLPVISRWTSREAAYEVRDHYRGHPNARRATSLVREPRRRFVGIVVERS
jgi:heme-degrading monooxygenase HmoA